jgi:16S rRNA (adenine1518-N6/adenine1519-N6)-dimethyltransferase
MNKRVTLTAKKKFGQNFLVNHQIKERVLSKIGDFADQFKNYAILEIGPGEGDLTQGLLSLERNILALEIDEESVSFLRQSFENKANLRIIQADVLDFFKPETEKQRSIAQNEHLTSKERMEINQFLQAPFLVVSNLPFNVGSRILVDLAINFPRIPFAVILQKEVAQKITKADTKFQFFGAWMNLFWDCKIVTEIPPSAFFPQPKVKSVLITGTPKNLYSESANHSELLSKLLYSPQKRLEAKNTLKGLLAYPNKTITNNLKKIGWTTQEASDFMKSNIDILQSNRCEWGNYKKAIMLIQKKMKDRRGCQ